MLRNNKRGVEETTTIIFIILAIIVGGLVVYFAWNFFNKGTTLIDSTDVSVIAATEACRIEIQRQPNSYCHSEKFVKMKAGGEMIVSCWYLDNFVKKGSVSEGLDIENKECSDKDFIGKVCQRIFASTSLRDAQNSFVNGKKCKDYLSLIKKCDIENNKNQEMCLCENQEKKIYNICLVGQKCNPSKDDVSSLCQN